MASHNQLERFHINDLINNKGYDYVISVIDNLHNDNLDQLICSLALFYKGAASFEWLENQPIPKLLMIQKQAGKINDEITADLTKANKGDR